MAYIMLYMCLHTDTFCGFNTWSLLTSQVLLYHTEQMSNNAQKYHMQIYVGNEGNFLISTYIVVRKLCFKESCFLAQLCNLYNAQQSNCTSPNVT